MDYIAAPLAVLGLGQGGVEFFEKKVRPVLEERCYSCHSRKAEKLKGGLYLDTREGVRKGGESGPAIVPGDAERSLLVKAIRYRDEEVKMPPKKKLDEATIADLVAWINMGAPDPRTGTPDLSAKEPPKLWSLEPLGRSPPPEVARADWPANEIDRFIRSRLEAKGMVPAPDADKRTLIRRATFDLVGLPPSPEELDGFLADESPEAYDRLVDRLLSSPQYGERWGRHWLDVVRYADTAGFENDHLYPNAWRYRDYVIRSFNADKPFDRFVQEQLAGDELWPGDSEAALGTMLYCVGPALEESAMVSNQLENEWLTDAVDTTGAAFLGLTLGCARCHDHKYDPILQKEYYGIEAFFASSDRPFPEKIRDARIKALNGLLSDTAIPKELKSDPRCSVETEARTGYLLFHRSRPLEVRLLHRGELSKPGEALGPAVPRALGVTSFPPSSSRAALAKWLTERAQTARVIVNRVWARHFGQGLVRTPNDFGKQGEPPTHPELLDWLAADLKDHGWSLKRLHRLILLSRTYRTASVASGPAKQLDPENRLLWHFPRRRAEGETIRDSLLACGGNLNSKQFGPAVVVALGKHELTGLFNAGTKWPVTKDPSEHSRRSVYLVVRRTFLHPMFAAFDAPGVMASCAQRTETVVPTQALTLLNSPLARDQAAAFARRLVAECSQDPDQTAARAWIVAFGRPIEPKELERAVLFLKGGTDVKALTELCLALFNANEFITID